jgi:DNA-binding beta-propeller fold protein YncE
MFLTRRAPVLMLLVSAGCSAVATPSSVSDAAATTASRAESLTPTPTPMPEGLAQVVDFTDMVWGVASAGQTIWVEGNELHQLDGATGEELQTLPGFWPTIIGDTLWYLRDDELVAADPQTGRERATYQPPILGTTVHDGILWTADEETGKLARIDLDTDKVLGQLQLPTGEPKWIEAWEGAIWVVIDGSDVVVRIDPRTGKITDTIETGSRPHSVVTGFGSLWVIEHGIGEVLRLEPEHGEIEARIAGPGINVAIAVAGDYVWASSTDSIMKIDPATNQVVGEIELGFGELYGMAASQGSLWVTTGGAGKGLYQIPIP